MSHARRSRGEPRRRPRVDRLAVEVERRLDLEIPAAEVEQPPPHRVEVASLSSRPAARRRARPPRAQEPVGRLAKVAAERDVEVALERRATRQRRRSSRDPGARRPPRPPVRRPGGRPGRASAAGLVSHSGTRRPIRTDERGVPLKSGSRIGERRSAPSPRRAAACRTSGAPGGPGDRHHDRHAVGADPRWPRRTRRRSPSGTPPIAWPTHSDDLLRRAALRARPSDQLRARRREAAPAGSLGEDLDVALDVAAAARSVEAVPHRPCVASTSAAVSSRLRSCAAISCASASLRYTNTRNSSFGKSSVTLTSLVRRTAVAPWRGGDRAGRAPAISR